MNYLTEEDFNIKAKEKFDDAFDEAISTGRLEVCDRNITDSDLKNFILPFLEENPDVKELDISHNWITQSGMVMLLKLRKFKSIDASYNCFGDDSYFEIIKNQSERIEVNNLFKDSIIRGIL